MLTWVYRNDASDLHLAADAPPRVRLHGDLIDMPGYGPIASRHLEAMLYAIMDERRRRVFEEHHDMDLAHALGDKARFRVNIFRHRRKIGAVMRLIPTKVRTADELDLPDSIQKLAGLTRGLVLVCGPTGSGKSTLLASLVDLANRTRKAHIVTIEDPIEFTHSSQLSVVSQREVGDDTDSFASGLRAVLRQDPDIILVGEMRDLETVRAALEAADTGHLVFGTLHSKSAHETVSRLVNMFPDEVQNQIQQNLGAALEAVIVQALVKTKDGRGRVPAREVMLMEHGLRSQIRSGKLEQIKSALQTGAQAGMHTMDTDLVRLVVADKVSYDDALALAHDQAEFTNRCRRNGVATGRQL
ncbi:type IV pilus twitching motility protein PilT [Pseudactinotalea terrae]|uniref:type IV pilus twitching motility protein PilT n=1 Tax=Pseudactinotalea terrae TaxID=1743262 RepID=UPI0012E223B8|nr:PilT/PilU family type 4a pilus ATPase [Pseudactinotalea terrae]